MATTTFNFEAFNFMMNNAQASTKAKLVNKLLGEVVVNTLRYRSPLQTFAMSLYQDSNDLVQCYTGTIQKDGFSMPSFEKLMSDANTGLKVYLVTQLIGDVVTDSIINQQPVIAKEAMDLMSIATHFREQWKEQSAKAQANKAGQVQSLEMPKLPDSPVADANEHAPAPF